MNIEEPNVIFGKSKWIWADDGMKTDSHIILRRTFSFGTERPPLHAVCRAACDSHYYLFVIGNAVVWHGALNRGKNVYYDEFDIGKFLIKGDNVIVAYCEYFGNSGRDVVSGDRAGFIFECNDLEIYSDRSFTVYENPAYKKPRPSNCFYAGYNIEYDASLEGQIQNLLDPAFNSSLFVPASELDAYPDAVNGVLLPRPLPLERFSAQPVISKYKKTTDQFSGDTYVITLPRTMHVTPYMEVTGNGQEKITIKTDRTDCGGSFGDEQSVYKAHSIEYITKPTVNIFEGLLPMVGQSLIFTMPKTVKVLKLGYRALGYNTDPTCEFVTSDKRLMTLFGKAENTVYNCLGSTIMDTPERERSMWLGDASVTSEALYAAFADAAPLVKKVIDDVLENSEDDRLFGGVPGGVPAEIPAHGLLALGEYGLFAHYRDFAGDMSVFRDSFVKLGDYLMTWEMTEHGVAPRGGDRSWYDNLYNADERLIENALYYSACKFMKSIGLAIGNNEFEETFDDRMENVAEYIESTWDGLGYTTVDGRYDDRANALIALCGLAGEHGSAVARLLSAVQTASPYFEWAVIEALHMLGRSDLAYNRFVSRYALAAESDVDTLGEDFNGYGSKCQGYAAAVINEIVKLFCGVSVKNGGTEITVTPDFHALHDLKLSLKLASGELDVRYKHGDARVDIIIENRTTATVTLVVEPDRIGRNVEKRSIKLGKGKNKFAI